MRIIHMSLQCHILTINISNAFTRGRDATYKLQLYVTCVLLVEGQNYRGIISKDP